MQKIQTVCVIGSGVMGSGIAAQVANSRTKVILLDIAAEVVQNAYDKLFTTKPPPLSHPDYAKYIQLGNLKDDIALIKEADLIIEVIVEKLEVKHQLYQNIIPYLKPTAILASNTSTLQLHALKENLPSNVKSRFIIAHFFNPPRYMELVELVTDDGTDKIIIPEISDFLQTKLGKTIVECNDTPGFIANRVGCFLLEMVVRGAIKHGLNPQQIDNIFSKDLGFPSTGIFGLYDLIGHDVMSLISQSLLNSLPKDDKYHEIYTKIPVLDEMREQGLIGRKAGAGFYKIVKDESGKGVKHVIDFKRNHPEGAPEDERLDPEKIKHSLNPYVRPSAFLADAAEDSSIRSFISKTLQVFFSYVNSLIPTVTTKKEDIDKAMKLGYSLKYGPFELMERLRAGGVEKAASVNLEGAPSHLPSPIILSNASATLRKIDDNFIFSMKTKMNVLDTEVFNLMIDATHYAEQQNKPIYIFPEGNNFSAGADLNYLKESIESKNFKAIDEYLALGQKAMLCLKYAKVPVIACARGAALGGGAEILLHAHQVAAHQNLNAGLVELGVGLIPAFGGTKEMFLRSGGDKAKLAGNLRNILTQNKSSSADYFAKDYGVLCAVAMHKDLLLGQTNVVAGNFTELGKLGKASEKVTFLDVNLVNEFDTSTFDALQLDVLKFFQKIIDKKTVSEQQLLDFEREKFLELASQALALERIRAITGK